MGKPEVLIKDAQFNDLYADQMACSLWVDVSPVFKSRFNNIFHGVSIVQKTDIISGRSTNYNKPLH
jgi:hypothetical protein